MNSGEKTILALAVGLGVGAVLGILFAPAKGAETRGRIKDGFGECCTKVGEMVGNMKDKYCHCNENSAVADGEEA